MEWVYDDGNPRVRVPNALRDRRADQNAFQGVQRFLESVLTGKAVHLSLLSCAGLLCLRIESLLLQCPCD